MLPALFEPAVPASEQPQTHALNRAAKEISSVLKKLYFLRQVI